MNIVKTKPPALQVVLFLGTITYMKMESFPQYETEPAQSPTVEALLARVNETIANGGEPSKEDIDELNYFDKILTEIQAADPEGVKKMLIDIRAAKHDARNIH